MNCQHKRRIFDDCADCGKHAWTCVEELQEELAEAQQEHDALLVKSGEIAGGYQERLARVRHVLDVCIKSIGETTIHWADPVSVDRWNTARAMLLAVRAELDRGTF